MHPSDFGTWFYYMLYVCLTHVPLHVALCVPAIPLYYAGRRGLLGAGTLLAITSGLTFAAAMFVFAASPTPERTAWALLAGALAIAVALRVAAPPFLRDLFHQCEQLDMVLITTAGAALSALVIPALPLDDDTAALIWVVGVSLYWSPAILIPRRLITGEGTAPLAGY